MYFVVERDGIHPPRLHLQLEMQFSALFTWKQSSSRIRIQRRRRAAERYSEIWARLVMPQLVRETEHVPVMSLFHVDDTEAIQ